MLAETVSIDGGTLFFILAALLVVLALSIAIVVFGFVLAPKAGRGSGQAMGWWIVIVALESLYAFGSLAALLSGDFSLFVLLPPAIIAGQVALFLHARKDADR